MRTIEPPSGRTTFVSFVELTTHTARRQHRRARLQRRGRSVRLVVTPHAANATAVQEDQALIELLAQGQRWFEQWRRGEVASLRAITQLAGKSERHVSQVIRTGFLAPDLVHALLHGRRPAQLTVRGV